MPYHTARMKDCYADGTVISTRRVQKAEILMETISQLFPARNDLTVVDFGCADGAVPVQMLRSSQGEMLRSITGVTRLDYNDLPEKPAYRHERFIRMVGDLETDLAALPLPWGTCDVVTATAFFHYLHTPAIAFTHAQRLLRPGGYLVAGMPARWVLRLRRCGIPGVMPSNHYIHQILSLNAWRAIAASCGFEEVRRQAVQWCGVERTTTLERWLRHHHLLSNLGSNYLVVYQSKKTPCRSVGQ